MVQTLLALGANPEEATNESIIFHIDGDKVFVFPEGSNASYIASIFVREALSS